MRIGLAGVGRIGGFHAGTPAGRDRVEQPGRTVAPDEIAGCEIGGAR